MSVRAKFYIRSIELFNEPAGTGLVKMSPVWQSKPGVEGNACEENRVFGKWTPTGELTMNIQNPDAFVVFREAFERKASFYLDFTEAPE